jgi:capsular exopolysaccharide synthesis family protein
MLERNRLVGAPGSESLWDRFSVLRSQVLRIMAHNGWRVLGITSAGRGEGKTWTAVNLAISISRQIGHTALLIDANFRRPAVHHYFDLEDRDGLASYLRKGTALERLLVHPLVGNLSVVTAGQAMFEASDFLASEHMRALVRDIGQRYTDRTVIFDLPAISDGDGVLSMLPHVDALLLVVEEGRTSRDDLARAVETLAGAALIGSVLNKSKNDGN